MAKWGYEMSSRAQWRSREPTLVCYPSAWLRYLWIEAGKTLTFSLLLASCVPYNCAFQIDWCVALHFFFLSSRRVLQWFRWEFTHGLICPRNVHRLFSMIDRPRDKREYCTRDNRNYISVRSSVLCIAAVFFLVSRTMWHSRIESFRERRDWKIDSFAYKFNPKTLQFDSRTNKALMLYLSFFFFFFLFLYRGILAHS